MCDEICADSQDECDLSDEEAEVDWITKKERGRRTNQLLFLGASLAITGISLSLMMLIFRTSCNSESSLGDHIVGSHGGTSMCQDSGNLEQVLLSGSEEHASSDSMIINVPWMMCSADSDCNDIRGFCGGGAEKLKVAGSCNEALCRCHKRIPDCGVRRFFKWKFRAGDYIPGCREKGCNETFEITVPLWKIRTVKLIGCETRVRTQLSDVMLWMQVELEENKVDAPLAPKGDAVWKHVAQILAKTEDVHFTSFWPSTISESVSDGFSPEGRIFFGFMLAAALCLKASDYSRECKTVHCQVWRSWALSGIAYARGCRLWVCLSCLPSKWCRQARFWMSTRA